MDYTITDKVRAWGKAEGYNVDAHVEFFNDYLANKTGKPYRDLDAAFRNCVRCDWGGIRAQLAKSGRYFPQEKIERPINGLVWRNNQWEKA